MSDRRGEFAISLCFDGRGGFWQISQAPFLSETPPLVEFPWLAAHDDLDEPPSEVRAAFEALIGYDPSAASPEPINAVEIVSDGPCAFDQPCAHGHRVEDHAVYCHNRTWLYAPGKCRRTWATGGKVRDEDCPGFDPNPARAA